MADFPGNIYAPPGVYTRTLFESPVSGVLAGVRIPVFVGTGNELLQQQDLEVIRGSSSSVDQQVPQEDETGRSVVDILPSNEVILGNFNGDRQRIQVRQFPITSGDGSGTTATDPSSIFVTINGVPDVVLSVARADIGVIEISTAPALGDDVRITYFFKRTDTNITDDVSEQVATSSAIIDGAIGNAYTFTAETNVFTVTVDQDVSQTTQEVVTATFPVGAVSAGTVVSLINGAAAGTSLVASTYTNNFGLTAVRLVADRDLLIGDGTANVVLGFSQGQNTNRNKNFVTFNGPIVDGTNGGITTTDTAKVVVRVDGTQVIPTELDGQNRTVTLPFAPEVGAQVTIAYYFNTWQDTFDYLANIGVTEVIRNGIVPLNNDFIEGADFILKDDLIVWGTAFLVNPGVTTIGAPEFGPTQISGTLIDNRWFFASASAVVDDTVSPPVDTRLQFQLPAQPTTGNGRDTPLGQDVFKSISNNRLDLPTNNPNLVKAYWGFNLQDAIQRGTVNVTEVEGTVITLEDPVPVGASVWATFWYNILVDEQYTFTVETSGPSGIGTYFIFDADGNPIFTPTFGSKGPGLTGVTIQFPSGSELTPDVRFEGGTGVSGPVEETVRVEFADKDATLAKFTVPGADPYFFVSSESDRARFTIDSSGLAGGVAGIDLSAPHGITGLGFNGSLLGSEIVYTDASGKTTYDIVAGLNDDFSTQVDNVVISTTVPAQPAVDADAYAEAINAAAKLPENSPYYDGTTRFLGAAVITAGEYDKIVFNYTGVTNGPTGPTTATIAPGTYTSPSFLATAVNSALTTAVGALPAAFDGLSIVCTSGPDGQMRFTFNGSDTDLGTFATGTVTNAGALLGDTITIDGVVLTGALTQVSGDLDFDTGQARATVAAVGVEPGDTITIDGGSGPVLLTAAGAQTPGGLNFDEGDQAVGTITVSGPVPGDTVSIDGITLTASGAQTPGGFDFDEGTRSTGTATLAGVQYGDTITVDTTVVGGAPVVLTADSTITPGGLNYNVGIAATGTIMLMGVLPASAAPYPIFAADTVSIGGTPMTPVEGARTPGADDFNAGTRAFGDCTVVVDALPTTGVLPGNTITISGVTLTAVLDPSFAAGGLNFACGIQALTTVTTAGAGPFPADAAAILTLDSAGAAGGPYLLTPTGGPARTSGLSNYNETQASDAALVAEMAAAINDPANVFAGIFTAAVTGASTMDITCVVPGVLWNAVVNVSPANVTFAPTVPFAGGVGTEITTATSIVAAVADALNGLSSTVQAHNTAGTSAVVDIRALTPGTAGNSISLVSSAPGSLTFSGAALGSGVGTNTSAATDFVTAVLDVANTFDTVVSAASIGDTVTLTAVTPGAVGNTIALSTTAAGRFVLSGALMIGGVGDDISAATSLVSAMSDAANGLVSGIVASNVGGTSAVVTIDSYIPGVIGDGILMAESTGVTRIVLSAGSLLGGVGTDTTVAVSIAAAINDAGNGIVTSVTALSAFAVVSMTAVTPGNAGNTILTASSDALRLLMSGPTLAGGAGTNLSVASSIVAAINDLGNGLAVDVMADNEGGTSTTVTVWDLVPGVAGNADTMASSDGTRLPVSGAIFTGGIAAIPVADNIVVAINDAGNGLTTIVTADNTGGTSTTVDLTAAVPGPTGNFITLASSDGARLPISGATLTGGAGLGGGVLEFIDGPTFGEDFAVLAGMSTDALPGFEQTKITDGDIVRRFTVAGTSGRLIYDRLIMRNRITPGSGSITYHTQLAQTNLTVEGTNAQDETGLESKAQGIAGIEACLQGASLAGEVGFKDGQVPSGTYADDRDGQPAVQFYGNNGLNPQNNEFRVNIDGTAFTVVFTDASGSAIPAAGQADVPLGPLGAPNTVLTQINATIVGAGLGAGLVVQEGASIRLLSGRVDTNSAVTINDGNANDVLGFSEGATSARTTVESEVVASALMMHHSSTINGVLLDYQSPDPTWFAAQALAGVEFDTTAAEYLFIQSQANNVVGLGSSSNIAFETASTDDWLLTGTGLNMTAGSGAAGETGFQGFFVTSSDPEGSGSADTSCFNGGVGQDGVIDQTYRDAVTGLVFTVLQREGGAAYPTGATSWFSFNVRKLVTTDANIPINSIPGLEVIVANTEGSSIPQGDTAIVETFDRGGTEPAVGDSYYVTYNYTKTEADFETQLFTNQRAVERNYGSISPDNPVSLAAFLAFLNGAVVLAIKQVPKIPGSNQASTPTYIEAFDDLNGPLPGGATLDSITPLKGDDVDLFLSLSNHCDIQSSIRFRAERTGVIGVASGTQPTDVGGIADQIKNTRMRLVYPDIVTVTIQDALGNDKEFLVDGTFLASAMAANRASPNIDVATPWTKARIVGFDQLARRLDAVQQNQIAVQGVTIMDQRGTVIRVRQGLTTDNTNILTKLPTVITIADEVQRASRRDLDRFIGIKFLPGVLADIEGQLATTMKALKNAEIIAAFTGIQARTTNDPTVVEVEAFYQPVFPLLYIVITFNLRSNLGG